MSRFAEYRRCIQVPHELDTLARYAPEYAALEGGAPFAWVRLSDAAMQECVTAASATMQAEGLPVSDATAVLLAEPREVRVQWHLLYRAMRDVKHPGEPHEPYPHRLAKDMAELVQGIDGRARALLVQRYTDWTRSLVPADVRLLDRVEALAVLDEIRKDPGVLRYMDLDRVRSTLFTLAQERRR